MHTNLCSIYTGLSLMFFRGCYKLLRKNNVTPVLSENIPCLIHACLSTIISGYALINYNPQNLLFYGTIHCWVHDFRFNSYI